MNESKKERYRPDLNRGDYSPVCLFLLSIMIGASFVWLTAAFSWASDTVDSIPRHLVDGISAGTNETFVNNRMVVTEHIVDDAFDGINTDDAFDFMDYTLLPISLHDLVGFALAAVGLVLAAGGGVGGGGLLVPIYILVMGFTPKHAIPLSNVTVFGGAVANTLLNARKRHPQADRPLIDWDLMLIMEPITIGGALIGANLNKLLPEIVIIILLMLLLGLTARKTLRKAMQLYRKETVRLETSEEETNTNTNEPCQAKREDECAIGERDDTTPDNHLARDDVLAPTALDSAPLSPDSVVSGVMPDSVSEEDSWRLGLPALEVASSNVESAKAESRDLRSSHSETFNDEEERESCESLRLENGDGEDDSQRSRQRNGPAAKLLAMIGKQRYSPLSDETMDESGTEEDELERDHDDDDDDDDDDEALRDEEESIETGRRWILEQERRAPLTNIVVVVGVFAVVLLTNLLKGGGAMRSPIGIECGSIYFWLSEVFMLLVIVGAIVFGRHHLLRKARIKEKLQYTYVEGDIVWDERSTSLYPTLCCFAGFVAGLFGIGGGIVKGPIMLALGVNVEVASATSAAMILFTSFTATTSFLVFGMIVYDYAAVCLTLGFFATLLGQTIMSWLMRRYHRKSYIAFCIGGVVALSAVCMSLESIVTFLHRRETDSAGRSGLCTSQWDDA